MIRCNLLLQDSCLNPFTIYKAHEISLCKEADRQGMAWLNHDQR